MSQASDQLWSEIAAAPGSMTSSVHDAGALARLQAAHLRTQALANARRHDTIQREHMASVFPPPDWSVIAHNMEPASLWHQTRNNVSQLLGGIERVPGDVAAFAQHPVNELEAIQRSREAQTANSIQLLRTVYDPSVPAPIRQQAQDQLAQQMLLSGMVAFHGSPHTFEKFDAAKIGTGQGAQTYGYGHYVAENPKVAHSYYTDLTGRAGVKQMRLGSLILNDRNHFDYSPKNVGDRVENVRSTLAEDLLIRNDELHDVGRAGFKKMVHDTLDNYIKDYHEQGDAEGEQAAKELKKRLEASGVDVQFHPTEGGVYTVDLPDEHIDKMLDWDAPLSSQPEAVKNLIKAKLGERGYSTTAAGLRAFHLEHGGFADTPMETIVKSLIHEDPKVAAEEMRKAGIPGIKYLDQYSRGFHVQNYHKGAEYGDPVSFQTRQQAMQYAAEQRAKGFTAKLIPRGTRNFVVFPGNEHMLRITGREARDLNQK